MRARYFFSETFTNLKRNLLMSVAAISTVTISLLLLAGAQILGLIVSNLTLSWEAKVEVNAYLRDDITQNEIGSLEEDISKIPQVQQVSFVSKEQAFENFRQLYRNQPEFWQSLPRDALPASFEIKLTDAKFAPQVENLIEGAPGVDDVRSGGEIVRLLLKVNALLRAVTYGMSIILIIAAAGLIANAIRLAIYARREEISIMKLVGATNWFIRIPFMLEGLFAAFVGALLAGGVVVATNALFSQVGDTIPLLRAVLVFSSREIASVLVLLIGVAAGVGIIGSALALRRFLTEA